MRIAHCSDLHLLSLAGARALDFANKRWIGGLNLLANRGRHYHAHVFEAMVADFNRLNLDHVLVTGDITNLALEDEFRFARRLFDAIRLGPEQVTVLPGNHDAYVARGAEYFSAHFSDYNRPDPGWEWPAGAARPAAASASASIERWPVVRVRGPVALVGLSTSLATPWFTAWGRVGDEQLGRLAAALADPRLSCRFRLVAIHHSPAGPRAESAVRGLRDRAQFAAVIARAGAELIVHGHEHLDLRAVLPGPDGQPIAVRGIQAGTYEAGNPVRRARYRIYEFAADRAANGRPTLVGESMRVWDPERGEFAPENAPAAGGEVAA